MKRLCGVSLLELPKRFSTAIVAKACAMSDISRRDFINGVGLTIASGLTPIDQIGAAAQIYPPAAHRLAGAPRRLIRSCSRTGAGAKNLFPHCFAGRGALRFSRGRRRHQWTGSCLLLWTPERPLRPYPD